MQRHGALILTVLYCSGLLAVTAAHAAALHQESYGTWFWTGIDWNSFGASAMAGLIGGALRTIVTLRSPVPTLRVGLELVGDACTALAAGFVVFLILLAWSAVYLPVRHDVTFLLGVLAGFMRGGVFTWLDESSKRILRAITDGIVRVINARAAALAGGKEPKA